MRDLDFIDDDQSNTVFRDLIMLTLAGFVVMVFLLLPHINPKAIATAEIKSPGNVVIEARWPDGMDADIDLWVQGPSDLAVGYSNQSASLFNLLRDDLGKVNDMGELNYEVAYSRGIPEGAYTINLHMYSNRDQVFPVPVTVTVSFKENPQASAKRLLTRKLDMEASGVESTIFRFEVNEEGKLIRESVHDMPKTLRTAAKGASR